MQIYKIYPDYLDISCNGSRNLIARYCSIYEYHANATSFSSSQYKLSTQWEQWGKELAKL